MIAPAPRERLAGLPGRRRLAVPHRPLAGLLLLGRDDVRGHPAPETVVDDDARLELARQRHELDALPVLGMLERVPPRIGRLLAREIVPEDVDLAIVGQDLADLVVQVGDVLGEITSLVLLGELLLRQALAARIPVVERVVRMVPVKEGVVEATADPGLMAGVGELTDDVAPERRLRRLVVRVLRVKETEALVMLGREDDVLHPRVLRRGNPLLRVEEVRIEVPRVLLVLGIGDVLVVLHPLVPRGKRVGAEVDEHAEPGVGEPGEAVVFSRGGQRACDEARTDEDQSFHICRL